MIKENELRSTSWVIVNGKYYCLNSSQDIDDYEHYDPIPLTPEILEKCGFEIENLSCYAHHKGCNFSLSKNDGAWIYNRFVGAENPKIKYLHTLQNAFFAMTGTELICNL